MSVRELTILKIQNMPEILVKEVNDFIDFIFLKQERELWESWITFTESLKLSELDMSDYLTNLQRYEEK
ncbi:MAG: hypothetical protein HQK77_22315, partial [Desulfobacterales bacterium]|nr:hypothetical protein [Desulfobacterales bacterium]